MIPDPASRCAFLSWFSDWGSGVPLPTVLLTLRFHFPVERYLVGQSAPQACAGFLSVLSVCPVEGECRPHRLT